VRRKVDFAQKTGEPTNQEEHRPNEQGAGKPPQVGREKFLHEQGDDNQTDEQRCGRAAIDRPTDHVAPGLQMAHLRERGGSGIGAQVRPARLESASPINDPGKSSGHYPEQRSDASEQKYGRDGELNGV
jgi:hypothetical protein